MNDLINQDWYNHLVEDCKAIITEAIFTSRWILVEGYWNLGKRIYEESKNHPFILESVQDLAQSIGLSTRTLYYANQVYEKYPNLQQIPEGKNITWNKLITKYLPQIKENKVEISIPEGQFNVIYADPPWDYEFSETSVRNIESHYPTLSIEEIKNIKVPSADNAVLFLWAPTPKLEEALSVLYEWGFIYRTNAVWDKEIIGMGYWFRGQHELLLVGTKGQIEPPNPSVRLSSVYREKRSEHSKKPNFYYQLIETYFPNGKYLELFAREQRKDWTSWGDQISM